MTRVGDAGLTPYLQRKAWRKLRRLRNNPSIVPEVCNSCPLELEHFYGCLVLLGATNLCCMAFLLIEIGFHRLLGGGKERRAGGPKGRGRRQEVIVV